MTRFALVTAFALVGCGSSSGPKTHHVAIRGMQFEPALVDVAVGDTVVWTNTDIVPHTVTSTSRSPVQFDSQSMAQNATWSYVVTTRGELTYLCTFHPTMFGVVAAK